MPEMEPAQMSIATAAEKNKRFDVADIKRQASGRWIEILKAVGGIDAEILDGRNHPCPKCGGVNRFAAFGDFLDTGGINCRNCHTDNNGDGIAAVRWLTDCDFATSLQAIADFLGIDAATNGKAESQRRIVATYDYRDEHGDLIFQVVRYDPKDFRQRKPKDGGGWDWKTKGLRIIPYRLPELLERPDEIVYVVEGEKDADNLAKLGIVATCNAGGAGKWRADHAEYLRGRCVVVLADNDDAGRKHAEQVALSLVGIAASIKVVALPISLKKGDVSDWIQAGGTAEQLRALVAAATEWKVSTDDEIKSVVTCKPQIEITLDENAVAEQVVEALGKLDSNESCMVYQRGGLLVAAVESEDKDLTPGTLRVMQLPTAIVRERIGQACELVKVKLVEDRTELIRFVPPKWLVDSIAQRGYYAGKIQPLAGIIQAPTIRADGSILQEPGYDLETGLIYRPLADFAKVPDRPSKQDAIEAAGCLLKIVSDFPFVGAADMVVWLCLVLSMIARHCVDGCVPLFAVTANIRGSGKSLLVDAASLISFGRPAARRAFPTDDNELRKTITTAAIEATPTVLFDNLDVELRGAALDAAVTSRTWQDRILGQSRSTGELSLRTVWTATGNNLVFGSDIARRVLPIRLASQLENPEERTGFQHADLLEFVADNRPRFAVAALTILRAYFVAGCPEQSGGVFGSFESWTRLIRGSLVWLGLADPLETRETAKASDGSAELLKLIVYGLLEADPDRAGLTTKQIERLATHKIDDTPTCPTLLEAIAEICGEKFSGKVFGCTLRAFQGRTVDGMQIRSANAGRGLKKWLVRSVEGGDGCFGGFTFSPNQRGGSKQMPPIHTHTQKLDGLEPNQPNQPNQLTNPSQNCPTCKIPMISSPAEPGWQNWDCPSCLHVVPEGPPK